MAKKAALGATGSAAILILVSFLQDAAWARWTFGLLAMAFPVLLMIIGAAGKGGLKPLSRILALLWIVLTACLCAMMLLSGADQPRLLGLPVSGAILLFGIWLAPLALVSLGYAWTFERFGVQEEDLERIRNLNRKGHKETEPKERREDQRRRPMPA